MCVSELYKYQVEKNLNFWKLFSQAFLWIICEKNYKINGLRLGLNYFIHK